ncbi:MAG: DNA translocase FtsK 4TM domain-containing protein [Planctomycetota bacterium]|jgi:S-DNA-T family DNA segregation ATPase FtsK/SpoIIIE|nr:DNA translocase FtsK 4TM domain-containing protein [Planctomycetota bacterium]MDP6761317.1 DNA translocase FtsK 4TM domain-containing protein [Planctomycetota bacterium]MDP6991028.1 DNA translocase FtsK 4TM domain-containing protein [Planctomycetota bacterium]
MARRGKGKRRTKKKARSGGRLSRLRQLVAGFLFGRPVDEEVSDRLQEIKGLILIGTSLWLLVSMVSHYAPPDSPDAVGLNWGGQAGYYFAHGALLAAGWGGYLIALLALAWGFVLLARKEVAWPSLRLFGGGCFVLCASFLIQLGIGPEFSPEQGIVEGEGELMSARFPYGPGGWLALVCVQDVLVPKFGTPGLWILLTLLLLVSFTLATEMAFYPAIQSLAAWARERREKRGEALGAAVLRWFGGLLVGLWEFLSARDLERAGAEAPPRRAARGAVEEEEDEEDEEEYEYEDEEEEDEEEYEYEDEEEEDEYEDEEEEEEDEEDAPSERDVVTPARGRSGGASVKVGMLPYETPTPPRGPWTFPPLDLLKPPGGSEAVSDDLKLAATKLENALTSFRVESEVVGAQVGPAVTLFELTVAQGTRMNKVTQLSQEIAAALKARSVRIIAPIPGRSTIGIEVPNKKRRLVRLRELIHKRAYDQAFMPLPLFLGMDAEGTPVVEDLARMPHLLIAGTTGSGKSVCINTIIASLLLTRSPHDAQMVLIDPKMVELQMFSKVPHLLLPVVTDTRQAASVINWLVEKMEGRYELFKDAGVRSIKAFNALGEEKLREKLGEHFSEERTPRHLPFIVVVIDEMADLMMVSKKEAETAITRLAQKSRAVGIHVILATQRPSTDVITGVIKGNLPTRIAFQVASGTDSRVILDTTGAEKLLGGGDMLYTPPQTSTIRRVQGALVEDDELQAVVDFVCQDSAPTFNQEIVQCATGTAQPGAGGSGSGPDDPLWVEAVRVVLKTKRGSASLLQRALSVGYTRASRLIDLMTEEGILGEHRGSKSREIMISLEDWEAQNGLPAEIGSAEE